uniref:Uncharacterized protein n=1 Tax=Arundo donax TaxID=35708 RepID=A0A0A8ZX78_ARUDO
MGVARVQDILGRGVEPGGLADIVIESLLPPTILPALVAGLHREDISKVLPDLEADAAKV